MSANNSFKPKLLRSGNGVAEKACHAVACATQFGLTQVLGAMGNLVADLEKSFGNLPPHPPLSLRGGNSLDEYETPPAFDPDRDKITPKYLETYFWGIAHLDAESWRFYLPHLLSHALKNIANPDSSATDALLFSLRPPDRNPPRFGTLTSAEEHTVVAVLDKLAFSESSVWQEQAMIALEEYWGPGATYR